MDKNELERRLEAAEKQNLGLLDEIKNLKAKLKIEENKEKKSALTGSGQAVKAYAKEKRVYLWQIAKALGVSEPTMTRYCRDNIPPELEAECFLLIDKIANENAKRGDSNDT